MTLIEKLKALYSEPVFVQTNGEGMICQYCADEEHDELCVWKVTQEAINTLQFLAGQLAGKEEIILAQVRNLGELRGVIDVMGRGVELVHKHHTADMAGLKGDLEIARLQQNAKLCSECPRSPELATLKAWIKSHWDNPFDHNAECLYCDELGEHDDECPFR